MRASRSRERLSFSFAAGLAFSSIAWAGADDCPMGSSPSEVAARFPPIRCRTVSLGGSRSSCNYSEPPATHLQFDARGLDILWGFPVLATSFVFDGDKLQEIEWTFEARGKPAGKVIDPDKLHAALESRFGKPASMRETSIGREGGTKQVETSWLVHGERWVYRTYPAGGVNVDLRRLARDVSSRP
jgi:hypothetical protein